jgi:hypothetical protein
MTAKNKINVGTITTNHHQHRRKDLVQTKTEINIPLMKEEVIVSKKPYVKEEDKEKTSNRKQNSY